MSKEIICGHCHKSARGTAKRCHDCGVEEGQYHKLGCDMERCPQCLGQLITCSCPPLANNEDRIIWVEIPNLCRLCGELWPKTFRVSDEEWRKVVPKTLQKEQLCEDCYRWLKTLVSTPQTGYDMI